MAAVDPESLVLMGRIYRAHGIRGELKVVPETDDPERFHSLETVYVGPDPRRVTAHVLVSVRFQHTKRGTIVIAGLEDVTDRDAAEQMRRQSVYAMEESLDLEDDDVFIDDLIGMDVQTTDGDSVGVVREIIQTPAQHVYVIARKDAPDALVPHVDAFVLEIDVDERRIIIDPIEGLLD